MTREEIHKLPIKAQLYINELERKLTLTDVGWQSEQLKPMVFKLANKLAIAGHGDAAVSMHRTHNRL